MGIKDFILGPMTLALLWHLRRDSRSMEELTKEAEAKLQMLLYTNGKTRGIVEKGNLGAVARHRDNLQALVKEIDALKLRVEQPCSRPGKVQKTLEVGAVALKNRSPKLTKKFRD